MKLGSGRFSRETGRLLCRVGLAFGALALLPAGALAGGGGSTTHWVALTGSPGTNTSCASPGFVGVTGAQDAIEAAATGDTVRLCEGTWNTSALGDGTLDILDRNIILRGSGQDETIIDGTGVTVPAVATFVMAEDSISLTVRDLTIQNATAEDPSAIAARGSLTIEDVIIRNNGGFSGAVGMQSSEGSLVIRRSTLIGQGEGVEYPTSLVQSLGPTTIEDSTFADNTGVPFGGVLIDVGQDPREVTVDSSTFSGLSSPCITALAAFGNVQTSITNSTFTGNRAGGGECPSAHVFSGGAPLVMRSSTFAGNTGVSGDALGNQGELLGIGGLTLGNNVIVGDPEAGLTCELNPPGVFTNEGGNVISDGTNGCDEFVGGPSPSLQTKVPISSIALGPLALNAPGTTETMALGVDSVARGAAIAGECPGTDQRGVARPTNICDSGAYQYASSSKPKLKLSVRAPKKVKAGKAFGITVETSNVAENVPGRAARNGNPTTATQVRTCAKLPKGLFVVKANGGKVKGRTICWTRSSLAPGKTVTYRATVRSSKGRSGKVTVRGTASASNSSGATVRISSSSRIRIVAPRVPDPSPPTG